MQLQQLEAEEGAEAEGVAEDAAEADCQPASLFHLQICMSRLNFRTMPGSAKLHLHVLCMLPSLSFRIPKTSVGLLLCIRTAVLS